MRIGDSSRVRIYEMIIDRDWPGGIPGILQNLPGNGPWFLKMAGSEAPVQSNPDKQLAIRKTHGNAVPKTATSILVR